MISMENSSKKPGGAGGGGGGAGAYACWSFSSYSAILLFIVPLVVVFGLISLLSPNSSNWVFISNYYLTAPSANTTAAANSSEIGSASSHGDVLGLRTSTVVVMDMHSSTVEEVHSDDYVHNRSASPPLAVQEATPPAQPPIINGTKEEDPMNETHHASAMDPATRQKEYTSLGRLEGHLGRARVAIREARFANKTQDRITFLMVRCIGMQMPFTGAT